MAQRRRRAAPAATILVTGFEPFGGESVNPSWQAVSLLPEAIDGVRVERCLVPCEFRRAIEVVADEIERCKPSIVLSVGQAGGRSHLSVERVAINVDDARIADNAGAQPIDIPVAPKGPNAHFATLPIKAMVAAMRAEGVPAEVSNTAGTFVCNHLMYGVLHYLAATAPDVRAGFVHVPYAEAQVVGRPGTASLALETMARGLEAGLRAALHHAKDIAAAEGRLD